MLAPGSNGHLLPMAEQQRWLETLIAACDGIVDHDETEDEIRVAAVDLRERLLVELRDGDRRAAPGSESSPLE